MKAEFYTQTRDLILTVPEIESVSLWYDNLVNDTDRMNRFPMIFIQMQRIQYNNMTANVQECPGAQIVVHVLFKAIDPEDTGVFDVSQAIYATLHRAGYRRISEQPIYIGGEIIDWQIAFEAPRFTDHDAKPSTRTTPKPPAQIDTEFTPF